MECKVRPSSKIIIIIIIKLVIFMIKKNVSFLLLNIILYISLCECLDSTDYCVCVFVLRISLFFFFLVQPVLVDFSTVNNAFMHCSRTHKFHFSAIFSLKISPTALFTHLKIILLQCFQFQFSVLAKISSIQMNPLSCTNISPLLETNEAS